MKPLLEEVYRATYLERTQQTLVNTHHCASVVKFAAVIWCTEESNQLSFGEELVAVFHNLMRSANQVHVVFLQESRHNIGPEGERHAAIIFTPAGDVFVRIRPQQITQEPTIRNLDMSALSEIKPGENGNFRPDRVHEGTYICRAHHTPYLFHGIKIWAEASVHSKNLLVDDCGNGQTIEAVRERLPQLDVVSAFAFIVEAIDTVDRRTFMVPAQDEEVFWVFDFVCQQEADGLQGLLATIHVIAEE